MHTALTGTKYPKSVLKPAEMLRVMGLGENNKKLGRAVTKGRFKGYKIYTVTLEERATCPTSCHHWHDCYGGNMPFAKRVDHTDPSFLERLETELDTLLSGQGRNGVLVRLHVLGDFYSVEYVRFWERMLEKHEKLALFGYTARDPANDPIGSEVFLLTHLFGDRCVMRLSGGPYDALCALGIDHEEDCPPGAFVCPEQTGRVKNCGACGACWSTVKNVAFIGH